MVTNVNAVASLGRYLLWHVAMWALKGNTILKQSYYLCLKSNSMAAGMCIFSGSVTDFTHQLPLTSRSVQGNKSFQLSDKAAKYMSVTVSAKPKRKKNRKNKNLQQSCMKFCHCKLGYRMGCYSNNWMMFCQCEIHVEKQESCIHKEKTKQTLRSGLYPFWFLSC